MRNQWYNGANMLGGRTDTKKDIGHWEHCWFLEFLLLATKSILFGRRENFVELGEEKNYEEMIILKPNIRIPKHIKKKEYMLNL